MSKNVLEPFVDVALDGTVFILTSAVKGLNSVITLVSDVVKIVWDINTGNYEYVEEEY
jgi:hypothetical protein